MELRTRKQVTVAAIFSLILIVFLGLFYFFFFYQAPVCTDGIQNGREEGIDCGGACTNACIEKVTGAPFTIEEVAIMPGGTDKYDVLGRIYNPNDTEGASSFEYVLILKDATGKDLATKKDTRCILPQEQKRRIEVG